MLYYNHQEEHSKVQFRELNTGFGISEKVEKTLETCDWNIDIVFSHTCPEKYIPIECFLPMIDQSTVDNSTEKWLDKIEDRLTYKKWYCGHWHIDKSIDKMRFIIDDFELIKRS